MAVNLLTTEVVQTDTIVPIGRKMTVEETIRTDSKGESFLWWGEVPNGMFLYTEHRVQKLLAKAHHGGDKRRRVREPFSEVPELSVDSHRV